MTPLPRVKDGVLINIDGSGWGPEILRITRVKGYATDEDVEHGRVRAEDRFGNAEADTAAELGRRSV